MKQKSYITRRVYETSQCRRRNKHLALVPIALVLTMLCASSAVADQGAFYVAKWGSEGAGAGQFESPYGIAVSKTGYIYVADSGNHRIQKFAPDGDFVLSWGGFGNADRQFSSPRGIAVDSSDNVYVADEGNNRIQKFDSSGNFLTKFGGPGTGNGQFDRPFAVAVRGVVIYVADTHNHRIQRFQSTTFGIIFVSAWGNYGTGEAQFRYPRGIAIDSDSNVYVADTTNNRIQQFDNFNAFVRQWNSQFNFPRSVAFDSNGVMYVADSYNHRIQKFAYGYYVGEWGGFGSGPGQFYYPSGVAVTNGGCGIVVSDGLNHRVQKFACDNSRVRLRWGKQGTANGEFNRPSGIAVDSSSNVYVADTNNHRIQKFSSTGSFLLRWGQLGPADGEFNHPTSVAVDREGYVYVADRYNHRVQKFTSSGTFVTKWSGAGPYGEQFYHPIHVAVDDFPSVYVVDYNKVWKFSKGGTFANSLGPNDGSNYGYLNPSSVVADTVEPSFEVIYVTNGGSASTPADIRKFRAPDFYIQPDFYFLGKQEGTFHGLAIDKEHNFYSFNSSTDRIQKFVSTFHSYGGATSVYFHEWGGSGTGNGHFNHPSGIAVDQNCNIYVVDKENHRIQKFSTIPGLLIF